MPDYQKGQIYRLWSEHTNKFYIGSTCSPLAKRLWEHRNDYNLFIKEKQHYMTSYELFKLGDVKIELLEDFPCNNKKELNRREGQLIRLHKDNLVNKNIAGRTHKEAYQERYSANRDEILEKRKEYYDNNREKMVQKAKDYRAAKKALLASQEVSVSAH